MEHLEINHNTWYSVFTSVIIFFFISSCYYDSEEYLFPEIVDSCDTTNVTFSNSVIPILQQHCYSCHDNSNAPAFGNNIKMQDYTDVKSSVDDGSLVGAVKHLSGYSPMPKGGGKIPGCSILIIEKWIKEGAINN